MKLKRYFFLVLVFISLLSFKSTYHPIHTSMTEIHYKEKIKTLEIAIKIFTDDLEKAIKQETGKKLYIGTDKEVTNTEKYIAQYLKKNFIIKGNNTKLNFSFEGKANEEDATWNFVEISNVPTIQKLEVSNYVLMDVHRDQKNIVHIHKERKLKKSFFLNKVSPSGSFTF